jgi:hypothetical protein
MMRVLATMILLHCISASLLGWQDRRRDHQPDQLKRTVDDMAKEIRRRQDAVSQETIERDKAFLLDLLAKAADGQKERAAKAGGGDRQREDSAPAVPRSPAVLLGVWFKMRTDRNALGPEEKLSLEKMATYSEGLGIIEVRTVPVGADIELNGSPYPRQTNWAIPESPGKHKLCIKKEGFRKIEAEVQVKKREVTRFRRMLEKE